MSIRHHRRCLFPRLVQYGRALRSARSGSWHVRVSFAYRTGASCCGRPRQQTTAFWLFTGRRLLILCLSVGSMCSVLGCVGLSARRTRLEQTRAVNPSVSRQREEAPFPQRSSVGSPIDEAKFEEIRKFFREKFPDSSFESGPTCMGGGTSLAPRVYVVVPVELEHLYVHDFSRTFLEAQLHSTDNLSAMVAGELLYLKRRLHSKSSGGVFSLDSKTFVPCLHYIVVSPPLTDQEARE